MNKSRIEQGLADYVQAIVTASQLAETVQVLPGKTDQGVDPNKTNVFCIVDRTSTVVGPIKNGFFRLQTQKSGKANAIEDYRLVLDLLDGAFPNQEAATYDASVAALSSAIGTAHTGVVCNGFLQTDDEDQEDESRWVDDVVVKAGLIEN